MQELQRLCDKFDMKRITDKISTNITGVINDMEIQLATLRDKECGYMQFIDALITGPREARAQAAEGRVPHMAMENYRTHLGDLESGDIALLKKQLRDQDRMIRDLEYDYEQEETKEQSMLEQRDELW